MTVIAGLAKLFVPTKGADEYAIAELENDVSGIGFAEVLVRSDNDPAILALKDSTATALKLAGVIVNIQESALYESQSNGLAESALKDVKDAVRPNLAGLVKHFGQKFAAGHPVLPRQALRTEVRSRTSSLALACEILCCNAEQMQERSRRQDSL